MQLGVYLSGIQKVKTVIFELDLEAEDENGIRASLNPDLFNETAETIVFNFKTKTLGAQHIQRFFPFWVLEYFKNVKKITFRVNSFFNIKRQDMDKCKEYFKKVKTIIANFIGTAPPVEFL